jgi:hypothetical protein
MLSLSWPEWCSSTLHDVKNVTLPSLLQIKKGERYIGATLTKTSALFYAFVVYHIHGSGCT